jgi:hypothetical protein
MGDYEDNSVYARARSILEHASGMPAYLCDDELWYAAVEEARAELGITERAPVCKYCGDVAPYGDERHYWIGWHYSFIHRWYWRIRNKWVNFVYR